MKSHYRWVIVAAGGFMGCVAIGSIFSLPVFLQPMMDDTGWSRASISLAMTLDFITMGVASFAWGVAMDRYGPRVVSLAGSILLGLGLVLAAAPPVFSSSSFSTVLLSAPAVVRFLRQIWPR